jgi:hypothetical protein
MSKESKDLLKERANVLDTVKVAKILTSNIKLLNVRRKYSAGFNERENANYFVAVLYDEWLLESNKNNNNENSDTMNNNNNKNNNTNSENKSDNKNSKINNKNKNEELLLLIEMKKWIITYHL